jgi:hypothetical protein
LSAILSLEKFMLATPQSSCLIKTLNHSDLI